MGAEASLSLWEAIRRGDVETVRQLVHQGRALHELDAQGRNVLMFACSEGRADVIGVLLDVLPADFKGKSGDTPLMHCQDGQSARTLLEAGAKPNAFNCFGESALFRAVRRNHELDLLRVLVDGGANPTLADNYGNTPLSYAASQDRADQIEILLSGSGRVDLERKEQSTGQTAMGFAFSSGCLAAAKALWARGANMEAKDNTHFTPLTRALQEGHGEMAHFALDCGVDIHVVDHAGRTPLMIASAGRMPDIVQRLLDMGADPDALDRSGSRACDFGGDQCKGIIRSHRQARQLDSTPPATRPGSNRRI